MLCDQCVLLCVECFIGCNGQYQWKYTYQLQQNDKAHHNKHTSLNTKKFTDAKSSVFTEHNNRRGNSTAKSQTPDDGYINVRNMLGT